MTEISVNTGRSYNVVVGEHLIDRLSELLSGIITEKTKTVVVTDDIVNGLYGNHSEINKLSQYKYIIANGEKSKCAEVYISLLNYLAENKISRGDCLIAFGGGVVGDLTGFAAATYMRGINYVQIPTTVLADVDSSVGGKTAIDLPAGKNLAGAFYQPSAVICDYSLLRTLQDDIFSDGCAEIIKYAIIGDDKLFSHLEENASNFDKEYVISTCINMKKNIVQNDEFDKGERQLLNYGHTIAHAIEKRSKYSVSHGRAVAMGIVYEAEIAYANGLCERECVERIRKTVSEFKLPVDMPYYFDELFDIILSDKKVSDGIITLALPIKIGKCILYNVNKEDIRNFMRTIK